MAQVAEVAEMAQTSTVSGRPSGSSQSSEQMDNVDNCLSKPGGSYDLVAPIAQYAIESEQINPRGPRGPRGLGTYTAVFLLSTE